MTRAAAKDLAGLLIVLALIVIGLLAYRATLGKDAEGQAERDWYYQHVIPKHSERSP